MRTLGAILEHPEELDLLMELVTTAMRDPKHIPPQPHWRFCYSMFRKFSLAVFLVLQELDPSLRDVICVLSLALKALDTIEDDTSIPTDVKVPILNDFHLHIYDREWHFSCGTKKCKALMDDFHYVSTAFLELDECYQDVIKDTIKKMGAGMAKFICEEVETIDDYDEYCHYVAGVIAQAISKLSHACGLEDLAPDNLSNSVGLFIQKCDIIQDYSEDINAMPKPRMFWPRHIWSKYVNKLEELKYEENSVKALQCLNDMVTNALVHVEDCFKYISALKDPSIFRLWALLLTADMGILTLCYNNSEVFRGVVKLRPGVLARIFYQTRSIDDVYHNFFDFTCTLKSKILMVFGKKSLDNNSSFFRGSNALVDESDPNAARTLSILEAIQNICREFGQINKRKSYMLGNKWKYKFIMILLGFIVLSIALANLSAK